MFSTTKKEFGKKLKQKGLGRPEIANDPPPNQGRLINIMDMWISIYPGG
ncbi:MAG: hypothetical protein HQL69_04575 [Magnetococcales bacterium]|nr:hypothetical protein [Magnetococcales bacterium]